MDGADSTAIPGATTVLEVARGILSDLDVDTVLDRVLAAARQLTGARYAAIGVLDDSRTGLARFVTAGIDAETRERIGPLPTGHGVLGELIRDPRPLRLRDVGRHPRSYGFPVGHPPMATFLGAPVVVDGEPFGNLYLTDKEDGTEFTDAEEGALVLLAGFAGLAIDHARRVTGAEHRSDELQRTVDALDATVQISRALGGQTDLDAILELVAKRGRALVSACVLAIELLGGGELNVAAVAGDAPPDVVGHRLALKDSVAGAALRTGRIQRLDDQLNRARFDEHGLGALGVSAAAGLVVPLLFKGRSFGVLVALDRLDDGPSFGTDDERLLQAFATSAATAVATAESVAAERRGQRFAAAEEERKRWARELHDETLQGLASLRVGLASARRSGDQRSLEEVVDAAVTQLAGEIAGLRALITELRPPALDQLGLRAALETLAVRTTEQGIETDVHVDLASEQGRRRTRLAPELETAVYRIVQEALTNAAKHGGARRAVVEVVEQEATIETSVRDDGTGFDTTQPTTGFGLMGMRERAELHGGVLEVSSRPGEGVLVRARLQVARREEGEHDDRPARLPATG